MIREKGVVGHITVFIQKVDDQHVIRSAAGDGGVVADKLSFGVRIESPGESDIIGGYFKTSYGHVVLLSLVIGWLDN